MKSTVYGLLLFLSLLVRSGFAAPRDYYQIRIYQIKDTEQEVEVDGFLREAFLPALHRAGVAKVGVFKPVETDTTYFGKRIYVFIPLQSFEAIAKLDAKLSSDKTYQGAAASYWNAAYNRPPYARMESILLKSFEGMPNYKVPGLQGPVSERVYELRSYEGPTERIFANKVRMFNEGNEIGLFSRLGFNAVFYSEVVSGNRMPNLMYMTSFNNRSSRDEHWKTFVDDPEWKRLSTLPEYQHNVSRIEIFLLHPTEYSEI